MPINYKNYPPEWKQIREEIKNRVGHCCENCGVPNYSIGYRASDGSFKLIYKRPTYAKARATKRRMKARNEKLIIIVLTVAHLDRDEWNHEVEMDRLAALCQKCHFDYDRQDNLMRKQYGKQYKRYQLTLV